jgi:flagellar FliL protein
MAENEPEEGEEKKSSKKIIIIAAVILLLAGAGAGYFFMSGDSAPADEEDAAEQVEEDVEGEAATDEVYFGMDKPLIVNFPKGSASRLIQVSVSLLVKGDETVEILKKHQPMIRNNLLMAISAKGAKNLMTREGKEELRSEMLKEVGKVLEQMSGKNNLSNLFFTTFVMQ